MIGPRLQRALGFNIVLIATKIQQHFVATGWTCMLCTILNGKSENDARQATIELVRESCQGQVERYHPVHDGTLAEERLA